MKQRLYIHEFHEINISLHNTIKQFQDPMIFVPHIRVYVSTESCGSLGFRKLVFKIYYYIPRRASYDGRSKQNQQALQYRTGQSAIVSGGLGMA